MDSPWCPSENALMDASGPIPSFCVPDVRFLEFRLHWFFCRYAYDNPTGNLDHTRKASM